MRQQTALPRTCFLLCLACCLIPRWLQAVDLESAAEPEIDCMAFTGRFRLTTSRRVRKGTPTISSLTAGTRTSLAASEYWCTTINRGVSRKPSCRVTFQNDELACYGIVAALAGEARRQRGSAAELLGQDRRMPFDFQA